MKGSDRRLAARHRPSVSDSRGVSVGSRPPSSASQIIRSDISGVPDSPCIAPAGSSRLATERRVAGAAYFVAPERSDPNIETDRINNTAATKVHTAASTAATAPQYRRSLPTSDINE